MSLEQELKKSIRDVPDFPKPGIIFKDLTPLFQSPALFKKIVDQLAEQYKKRDIDVIVGIESRGFLLAAPLAYVLQKKFSLVRKKGKLPWKTVSETYDLEYGSDTIQMHEDAIQPGDRVLILDDLLATGGTALAASNLIKRMGGNVVECAFVVELEFLKGREKLKGIESSSLIKY